MTLVGVYYQKKSFSNALDKPGEITYRREKKEEKKFPEENCIE